MRVCSYVLGRPRVRRRVDPQLARAFIDLLRAQAELRSDPAVEIGLTSDPKDDYVVALARSTRADLSVSGDVHLTALPDADPPVLTPARFLEHIVAGTD
jgi:predicted nucleic acid-binding protein